MATDDGEIAFLNSSPAIGELAGALAAAQAKFGTVVKDNTARVQTTKGPDYTYKYADLASCLAAVRGPLSEHGLAVMQLTVPGGQDLMLRTILAHSSGQWIASDFPLIVGEWGKPQAVGSVITYVRRYALCALLQIATDDDDGAAAQQHAEQRKPTRQPPADRREVRPTTAPATSTPGPYPQWLEQFEAARVAEWAKAHPGTKPFITKYQINGHLLKFRGIMPTADWPDNLKAATDEWRHSADAMADEAKVYCRKEWLDAAAKLKAKPREPGADDNMPSPDEDAAYDRMAPGKAGANA